MIRLTTFLVLCVSALFMISASPLFAQPTDDSLIQAWEKQQKADPKTIVFEKLKDRHYKFKTSYFPYEGELSIKNLVYGDLGGDADLEYSLGTVQVELSGFDKNLVKQYGYIYSMWESTNTLYFDKKNSKWLSSKEYAISISKRATSRQKQSLWVSNLSNFALIAILACGLLVIYKKNKTYTNTALIKQEEGLAKYDIAVQQSEKALKISEETNTLLREILVVLKSKN
ncbi:MAG: hypothetical protein PHY09_12195 [Desulfuromonadaceae bacterium]|nr:hypothetical protein [Desulfuromonadaceae bacterium]MDD5107651.1 hypothetical protein [Desulfuromonadaceae bacterium]